MADPFHKVRPGEPLRIHAQAWNKMLDVVGPRHALGADSTESDRPSNIILVRNDSGQPVPFLGVLTISGVAISPANGTMDGTGINSYRARDFALRPVAIGSLPENTTDPIAVALESIEENGIGRCACSGMFAVRVHISNANHMYAGGRNGDVTQLASATCGPVRLMWKESSTGSGKWAIGKM